MNKEDTTEDHLATQALINDSEKALNRINNSNPEVPAN